mmetsp:Transcript_12426/g.30958  ORF Transcript_12426/g.30958 Transcript_12426/m.30958 type:complete len:215 (-) Transcript_12426:606-1250(-)
MRTTCTASKICCCLPMRVSNTPCSFMSFVPLCIQSTPRKDLPSRICMALTAATVSIELRPEFSASAPGVISRASANARIAYCSMEPTLSDSSMILMEHAISEAPPPYTILLVRTKLRTTQIASWRERLASSMTILFPPRTNTVTAFEFGQSSITTIRSFVVPNDSSCTLPALPSLSAVSSEKRGTMRASQAIARSSISTPPTQRMAGRSFCMSR